jgi:hypothetical protein
VLHKTLLERLTRSEASKGQTEAEGRNPSFQSGGPSSGRLQGTTPAGDAVTGAGQSHALLSPRSKPR